MTHFPPHHPRAAPQAAAPRGHRAGRPSCPDGPDRVRVHRDARSAHDEAACPFKGWSQRAFDGGRSSKSSALRGRITERRYRVERAAIPVRASRKRLRLIASIRRATLGCPSRQHRQVHHQDLRRRQSPSEFARRRGGAVSGLAPRRWSAILLSRRRAPRLPCSPSKTYGRDLRALSDWLEDPTSRRGPHKRDAAGARVRDLRAFLRCACGR